MFLFIFMFMFMFMFVNVPQSMYPPGTAKSEVGRRLSQLIQGSYFERLLTRFSVPEELFGPLSMRALEEDKYVRQTRGYLPDAQVGVDTVCVGRVCVGGVYSGADGGDPGCGSWVETVRGRRSGGRQHR
jgi:hypothetical protein